MKQTKSDITIRQTESYVVETTYREFSIHQEGKQYKLIQFGDEIRLLLAQHNQGESPRFKTLSQDAIDAFIASLQGVSEEKSSGVEPLYPDAFLEADDPESPILYEEPLSREVAGSPSGGVEELGMPAPMPTILPPQKGSETIVSAEELLALLRGLD